MNDMITFIYTGISNIMHAKSKIDGRPRCKSSNRERQEKASRRTDRKRKGYHRTIPRRIRTCKAGLLCGDKCKEDTKKPWRIIIMLKDKLSIIPLFFNYLNKRLYPIFIKLTTTLLIIDALDTKPELALLLKYIWLSNVVTKNDRQNFNNTGVHR